MSAIPFIPKRLSERLDSIWNALSGFGDPLKDKGAAGRPRPFVPLQLGELRNLYRCNGHARRWVDFIADESTTKGWGINDSNPADLAADDEDGDGTVEPAETGLDLMHDEDRRLLVRSRVGDAFRWARRDGGAWLLVVTDGDLTGEDTGLGELLAEPIDLDALQTVDNLVVLTRDEVTAFSYDGDIRSENFRHPKTYLVSMGAHGVLDPNDSTAHAGSVRVHQSRLIYFAGAKVSDRERFENGGIDDSILQAVWDQLRNMTTIEQAGANLAQEMHLHVVKVGGAARMEAEDQLRFFDARMRLLAKSKSSVGMVVLGEDEEYQTLAAPISGFEAFQGSAKDAYASVTGLAQTTLFGDSPGGLSTDDSSGRMQLNRLIGMVQAHRLKQPLVKLYGILFAQKNGPTSGWTPENWDLEFAAVNAPSDQEQANLEKTHAETDAIRITSQVVTPEHVTASRFGPAGYQNELAPVNMQELEDSAFAQMEEMRGEMERERAEVAARALAGPSAEPADAGTSDEPPEPAVEQPGEEADEA